MSRELSFVVTHHSPFLAATGFATQGYDATVDLDEPLRADAIKGAMRSTARNLLGIAPNRVDGLFGSPRQTCRWHWIVGETMYASSTRHLDKHRVAIDPDTHTAVTDQLQSARLGAIATSEFTLTSSAISERQAEEMAILTLAARATHALGAQRRRGLGWIGISGGSDLSTDSAWTSAADILATWRSR